MKISDIETILAPTHNICIEKLPENESRAFYTRDAFYIGEVSNIPDNLKSADVINIEANDFLQIIVRIDERSLS